MVKTSIKVSQYFDSVSLMLAARELAKLPGVQDAAIVMATEANKGILREAGMLTPEAEAASSNDLVIAVKAAEGESGEMLEHALVEAEQLLLKKQSSSEGEAYRPKTIRGSIRSHTDSNVAVISVAGRYAAEEAWEALYGGLHVLLFSDNVSLEDEIALKRYAVEHGMLLMGPGAGTAIINGVALGFANALPAGPVGIVSAAGTGLQEVSTLLAKFGVGISQGIGTGGRDLKREVGGLMMLAGLEALQADPATQVILLVSKPPASSVAQKVLSQVAQSEKPSVVCLLGGEPVEMILPQHQSARTLEEAARKAAELAGSHVNLADVKAEQTELFTSEARKRLVKGQRYLRGLFSGGTLCYESQVIWGDLLSEPVFSNAPLVEANKMVDSNRSQGHCAVDLGEEEFTVGRPHPMIDNDLRIRRLLQEAQDPSVAVIVLDVVLGYGAHPDPAGELAPAVLKARKVAEEAGRRLFFVASITGTEEDPQRLSRQRAALDQAGVVVMQSNAAAARLTLAVIKQLP
jgi:succinyl-CoA synthetase alpha subunit